MGRARPDQNNNFSLIAVSSADGFTPIELWADPTTHALLSSGSAGGSSTYATNIDSTTTANMVYVGKAVPGTSVSAPFWQIKLLNKTSGLITTFADGDANFDNIWANRASLTYS